MASFGMNDRTVNDILKNPIYNGWVARKGERVAAPWRLSPPVDDSLWERVQSLLAGRTRGGGPRRTDHPDALRGLVRCVCGSSMRASGFMVGRHRRVHSIQPCPEGISKKLWASDTWLAPIEAQLAGLRVDDRMVAEVIAVLSRADQPAIPIDHARFDRMRRQLALEVADGKIGEQEFLAAMRRLKEERAGLDAMPPTGPGISAPEAVDYIRKFAATWAKAKPASRAALVQSVYEEIVVRGEEFVRVRLTQDAYAHGFALALAAQVSVPLLPGRGRPRKYMSMARPTGFEPATFGSGTQRSIH